MKEFEEQMKLLKEKADKREKALKDEAEQMDEALKEAAEEQGKLFEKMHQYLDMQQKQLGYIFKKKTKKPHAPSFLTTDPMHVPAAAAARVCAVVPGGAQVIAAHSSAYRSRSAH